MIDEGNRQVKELRRFLRENFINPPRTMVSEILEKKDIILGGNKININDIFDEKKKEYFKKYNNTRMDGDFLSQKYVDFIIDFINKILEEEAKPTVLIAETRSKSYKNVIEKSGELFPDCDFDIKSLKLNLFYNNNIEFEFNDKIPLKALDRSTGYVQTIKLEINGAGDLITFPTKYEVICTARVKGIECSNIVSFCDIHKNSQITCSDNPTKTNPGHVIKKLDSAPVKESTELFAYDGKDVLADKEDDLKIFSLVKIDKEKIVCNVIYVVEDKDEYVLVLSLKEEEDDNKILGYDILHKDDNARHFLDDIFKSLQKYLLREHNIIMTSQNKIIGEIIIFILLNKIFYDKRMNAFIIGKSGSGKSFWASYVIPMFTFNYKIISGNDVTRNRFLGGRSNMISSFKNSLFQVGYVGSQDIIFAEESTEPLNKFFDPNAINKESNIFSMLKVASGPFDVGIQGSKSIVPKASVILVGNLEQLNHIQRYKNLVAKRYRNYSSGLRYKNQWPLFKPLEFYKDNIELAKAQMHVRKHEWSGHYVTKLPEAEFARLSFLITLEDVEYEFEAPEMERETVFKKFHRSEFVKELRGVFNVKIPDDFKSVIYDYYINEFLRGRNNIMKNGYKSLNRHILNKQFEIIYQFIFMNKLYYGQELVLTEMDKMLVENFMLYNFNCIGSKEAALVSKPFINDYLGITDEDELTNYDLQKKEDYVKKLEADKKEILDMVSGEDLLR